MTIDTKRREEYCEKRADLEAQIEVQRAVGHFALEHIERCKKERDFVEQGAWLSVLRDSTAKLHELNAKYSDLIVEYRDVV